MQSFDAFYLKAIRVLKLSRYEGKTFLNFLWVDVINLPQSADGEL